MVSDDIGAITPMLAVVSCHVSSVSMRAALCHVVEHLRRATAEERSDEGTASRRSPLAAVGSSARLGITNGAWSAARSRRRRTNPATQLL
jgi:hypothetical protein